MKSNEAITNQIETLKRHIDADGLQKVFNIAHAYLQGLQDAGAITEEEHDKLFHCIALEQ